MTDDTEWGNFGDYGAEGERSADLLADAIRELSRRRTDSRYRSFAQKVRYLRGGPIGFDRLRQAAGKSAETLRRWALGSQEPANTARGREERRRVEAAFHQLREDRVEQYVIRQLNNKGRGTSVELYAVDQRGVPAAQQREYVDRVARDARFNITQWDDLVRHALAGDEEAMRLTWDDVLEDSGGSDWYLLQWASAVEILPQ